MRKQSKRVAATKDSIETAYLDVLANKPGGKITVKEVCDKASINRTTFYKYYSDADNLGMVVRQNMLDYIERLLQETIPADLSDIYEFVSQIILNIYRDPKIHRLPLLYREEETRKRFNELLWHYYYTPKYGARFTEEEWIRVTYSQCGVLGLIEFWINEGMTVSPEKIANSVIAFAKRIVEAK